MFRVEDCRAKRECEHNDGIDLHDEVSHPVQRVQISRKQLIRSSKVLVDVLRKKAIVSLTALKQLTQFRKKETFIKCSVLKILLWIKINKQGE